MKTYPCVLSIAGSDCSGGAGIQADLKTISAHGAYAATAVTAVTVQNSCGVTHVHPVPPAIVEAQITAVMEDLPPHAIKIGMVNDAAIIRTIARTLRRYPSCFVVLDPVMVSSSGRPLLEPAALTALTDELMPLCSLVTPNLPEAELLLDIPLKTLDDMHLAARSLLRYGNHAVLLKGGHLDADQLTDVLQVANEQEPHLYTAPKVESRNTHGTGCTLSSAIAARMALGDLLPDAVAHAKHYVHQALVSGRDIWAGKGHGPMNHLFSPQPMHIFHRNEL
ncbi:MAG: bifunctional hydroxymethylpyrimidine kinase/phosphomethylpyrimidine kinase [Bacteroidales bacterium]|nr:bifunctional hydroxymethylpyrimidine kinase/phosphomethylpyrimidine kinase [Bacteroidales bacterium]